MSNLPGDTRHLTCTQGILDTPRGTMLSPGPFCARNGTRTVGWLTAATAEGTQSALENTWTQHQQPLGKRRQTNSGTRGGAPWQLPTW